MYLLLKRLPGYTAQALFDEDASLVDDFMVYRRVEDSIPPPKS